MLLDDIVNGAIPLTNEGIVCSTPDGAWRVFNFMRQAILDRHIYITKAIGVRFIKDVRAKVSANGNLHIEGYYNCGESYPELMVKLSDKVYLVPPNVETLDVTCNPGVINAKNAFQGDSVLYTNPYMLRVLSNAMVMRLTLKYDCGFKSQSFNSRVSSDMFPFYTDNSLSDFVRVLPMQRGQTLVPMRFRNGMTVEKFMYILRNYQQAAEARTISKEETVWLQNFAH